MTAPLIFRNLTLGYDRHPAVHHLDGALEPGSLTAVVGPNGAGKSTLFKGMVGLLKPLAGGIERHEAQPQDIAYLPQIADIDRSFPINVYDLVSMGLWRSRGLFGGIGRKDHDAIERALGAVGLTGFERRPIGSLSGGQMQRMLFARLLLQDARLIILDEPFNAIDARTSADLLALVRGWHAENRTVIAALHDLEMIAPQVIHVLANLGQQLVAQDARGYVPVRVEHHLVDRSEEHRRAVPRSADDHRHLEHLFAGPVGPGQGMEHEVRNVDDDVRTRHLAQPAPTFHRQLDLLHALPQRNIQRGKRLLAENAVRSESMSALETLQALDERFVEHVGGLWIGIRRQIAEQGQSLPEPRCARIRISGSQRPSR